MKRLVAVVLSICFFSPLVIAHVHKGISGPGSHHRLPSRPPINYYHPRYYSGLDYADPFYYNRVSGRYGHPNRSFYHQKTKHLAHPYYYHGDSFKADLR